MRDILFRGKDVDSDEWACGYYEHIHSKDRHYIYTGKGKWYEIRRESVGEFSGLYDKNSKMIFEGDICRVYTIDTNEERLFTVGIGKCVDSDGEEVFCAVWAEWDGVKVALSTMDTALFGSVEVIGNIYDNHELLGEQNNA
mgnify:CR=1 FL=1